MESRAKDNILAKLLETLKSADLSKVEFGKTVAKVRTPIKEGVSNIDYEDEAHGYGIEPDEGNWCAGKGCWDARKPAKWALMDKSGGGPWTYVCDKHLEEFRKTGNVEEGKLSEGKEHEEAKANMSPEEYKVYTQARKDGLDHTDAMEHVASARKPKVPESQGQPRKVGDGVFEVDMVVPSPSGDTHKNVTVYVQAGTAEEAKKIAVEKNPLYQLVEDTGKLIGKVIGPGVVDFDAKGIDDPKFKGRIPVQGKVVSVEGNTVSIEWEYDDKSTMVEPGVPKEVVEGKVPANAAGVVDDKIVKILAEDIPGGPIQGDVPAGVSTSANAKLNPVPGNKTNAPGNIEQKIPEEEAKSYQIVAQGISLRDVADKVAAGDSKRRVIPDEVDPKKFMVVQSE